MTDFESYAEKVRAALAQQRALAQARDTDDAWHCWRCSWRGNGEANAAIHQRSTSHTVTRAHQTWNGSPPEWSGLAHVLALLDEQETAVGLAVEGLRRHVAPPVSSCIYGPRNCPDARAWWSVLTGIGATYGVTHTDLPLDKTVQRADKGESA
jgi:hypothetical protein